MVCSNSSKSILKKDLIATDQRFPNRIGEIYHLAYNNKQKWLWIPNMKDSEILLLKGWDSLEKYIRVHQPKLSLFGDVHQPKATKWTLGKTICINVGYFRANNHYLELSSIDI